MASGCLQKAGRIKAKIKEATTQDEKLRYAQLLSVQRLAAGVIEEHDAVFKTLLK